MKKYKVDMHVPKDIYEISKVFHDNNKSIYIVGGAVRDFLRGKEPHDYDLVTDSLPEETKIILKKFHISDEEGKKFGVIRIYTKDEPLGYELAVFRKDISLGRDNKGDNEKVKYGDDITIKEDCYRRDLTINGLYYDIINKEIIDLVGGINDIKNNIIRTIGNPVDRFNEDRLRLIRVFRISSTTDSVIHEDTSNAILNDNRLFGISDIDDVSKERIYAEFEKVREKSVSNDDKFIMKRFFDLLNYFNITSQIYPVEYINKEIKPTFNLSIAISQLLSNNDITPEFIKILVDSKISNNMLNNVLFLLDIKNGITSDNVYTMYNKMKSKNISKEMVEEWIYIMDIDTKNNIKFLEYEPSTSGRDVISDGFKGVEIGNEINRIEKIKFEKLLNN